MASWWKESNTLTKTAVGLAVAGTLGTVLYVGYRKIHVGTISGQIPGTGQSTNRARVMIHEKCRSGQYPRCDVQRPEVPRETVPWSVPYPEYKPIPYTSDSVLKKPVWADIDYMNEKPGTTPLWNAMDGKVDRRSHTGNYKLQDGLPRNPVGRTGICGRGSLGRWGPNHAADPIVSRWKRDTDGSVVINPKTKRRILQFVAIKRSDSGLWAIPGGMVDPGEKVSVTLKREFGEEALNTLEMSEKERHALEESIHHLFQQGTEVYRGYVDDPRNTDNSWMETIAVNFHDETGQTIGRFNLAAGDDAVGVQWTDIDRSLNLYASHLDFIREVAERHSAHW